MFRNNRNNRSNRNNRDYRKKVCSYCKDKTQPDYKDADSLKRSTNERVKIIGRARTGTCAYHQRKLATAIKRARIIAIIPFIPKI